MFPAVLYDSGKLVNGLKSGQNFLLNSRTKIGWWKDFITYAGQSDEWVSAYVASILAKSPDEKLIKAVVQSWNLLRQRRRFRFKKGWGFNKWTPSDADTTGWVLNLYLKLKAEQPKIYQEGISFLQKHLDDSGGFATYSNKNALKKFTNLTGRHSFDGWCSAHPCVTATITMLPEFRDRALLYLVDIQKKEGDWPSYWWLSKEYVTYLSIEAIYGHGKIYKDQILSVTKKWALNRVNSILNQNNRFESFALASGLGILALDNIDDEEIAELLTVGIETLLKHQQPDGSWPASARLRIPPPDIINPDEYQHWIIGGKGGGSIITDKNRIFTTATVMKFLMSLPGNNKFP